jgi:hypothetical protein
MQDGNFSMACDTHQLTLSLNWCLAEITDASGEAATSGGLQKRGQRQALLACDDGDSGRQLSDFEAQQRGCWNADEAQQWRRSTAGLRCGIVRELRCEGGMFTARLSAKSAERQLLL